MCMKLSPLLSTLALLGNTVFMQSYAAATTTTVAQPRPNLQLVPTILARSKAAQTIAASNTVTKVTPEQVASEKKAAFRGVGQGLQALAKEHTPDALHTGLGAAGGAVLGGIVGASIGKMRIPLATGIISGGFIGAEHKPISYERGTRLLIDAILTHDTKKIDDLLKERTDHYYRVDPNRISYLPIQSDKYPTLQGSTPLVYAVAAGNVHACQALLTYQPRYTHEMRVNVNATTQEGKTALHIAVEQWLQTVILQAQKSLMYSASPQAEEALTHSKQTAQKLISILIKHKADETVQDSTGNTVFDLIEKAGIADFHKKEIIDLINQSLAERNKLYERGTQLFIDSIIEYNDKQLVELLKKGINLFDPNRPHNVPIHQDMYPDMQGSAPLLWAAAVANNFAWDSILCYKKQYDNEKSIDIYARTPSGKTVLHIAVERWLKGFDHKYVHESQKLIASLFQHNVYEKLEMLKDNAGKTIFDIIQYSPASPECKRDIIDFIEHYKNKNKSSSLEQKKEAPDSIQPQQNNHSLLNIKELWDKTANNIENNLRFSLFGDQTTKLLIKAIVTHNDNQFDNLLKNRNGYTNPLDPSRKPSAIYETEHPTLQGSDPILWAAAVGNLHACQKLLAYKPFKGEKPVNAHARTSDGKTALHLVVKKWLSDTATITQDKDLLDHSAMEELLANIKHAAQKIIALFIEHRVGITSRDHSGKTIFDLIQESAIADLHKKEITDLINQCITERHNKDRADSITIRHWHKQTPNND